MKEDELRLRATCFKCGDKIGRHPQHSFFVVKVRRWVLDAKEIESRIGLDLLVGNAAVARALSPDKDLAQPLADEVEFTVCGACAIEDVYLSLNDIVGK